MAPGLNKEETKAALKEAIKEWMDERYRQFGKWTFHALLVALFGAVMYLILKAGGGAETFRPHMP